MFILTCSASQAIYRYSQLLSIQQRLGCDMSNCYLRYILSACTTMLCYVVVVWQLNRGYLELRIIDFYWSARLKQLIC